MNNDIAGTRHAMEIPCMDRVEHITLKDDLDYTAPAPGAWLFPECSISCLSSSLPSSVEYREVGFDRMRVDYTECKLHKNFARECYPLTVFPSSDFRALGSCLARWTCFPYIHLNSSSPAWKKPLAQVSLDQCGSTRVSRSSSGAHRSSVVCCRSCLVWDTSLSIIWSGNWNADEVTIAIEDSCWIETVSRSKIWICVSCLKFSVEFPKKNFIDFHWFYSSFHDSVLKLTLMWFNVTRLIQIDTSSQKRITNMYKNVQNCCLYHSKVVSAWIIRKICIMIATICSIAAENMRLISNSSWISNCIM